MPSRPSCWSTAWTGWKPGLYRFIATRHALLRLPAPQDITEQVMDAAPTGRNTSRQSAVTFIWVAVTERMSWRYVERSMRYLFLDAGHVCQNLYLAAESIGCGVCAIAAYDDAVDERSPRAGRGRPVRDLPRHGWER